MTDAMRTFQVRLKANALTAELYKALRGVWAELRTWAELLYIQTPEPDAVVDG